MRKLTVEEIECRVAQVGQTGCSLLLYKTARVDRAILDEEFGSMNWQNDFKVIDGKMYGGIGIKHEGEWVWKWDCGTESNTEAEKGQASDCFKRAGFKWGIGVELYSAPFIFIQTKTQKNDKGKWELVDKYMKFKVIEIGYNDQSDISNLVIIDNKKQEVFRFGGNNKKPTTKKTTKEPTTDEIILAGLAKMQTSAEASAYYKDNENNVTDLEAFKAAYSKRWMALRAKEKKVDNE